MARIGGLLSFLFGAIWYYRWEAIRAFLYEKGFHLMPSGASDTFWQWAIPLGFAGLGLYLFFKTGKLDLSAIEDWSPSWLGQVPLHIAARRVYEAAEKAGVLDLTVPPTSSAEVKLTHFKMLLMVDSEAKFFGVKPPSTKSMPIPIDELHGQLYPVSGEVSSLINVADGEHSDPLFINVTVPRNALRRITRKYLTEYTAEARRYSRR